MTINSLGRTRRLACGIAALAIIVAGCLPVTAAIAEPVKRALLIGIDEYADPDLRDLRGAVNDVNLMQRTLVGKFDVPPENVTVLTNEQATREGILTAIRSQLIEADPPADIAIIHYSGHGSQMRDAGGEETDGWDETLVPHDARVGNTFDISDDEINALLQELAAVTGNITLIMDSCHSGSLTRAAETGAIVRQVPRDDRPLPATASLGAPVLGESAGDFRVRGINYTLISGSAASELSNESVFEGRQHGALTYYLVKALQGTSDVTTYRDIMASVTASVSARFPGQHPQAEGTVLDTQVFGDRQILAQPFALVSPAGTPGLVSIEAGRAFGLGTGAQIAIYPPATKDFRPDGVQARATITRVGDFESEARLDTDTDVAPFSRAPIASLTPADFSLALALPPDDPDGRLDEIRTLLAEHESIRIDDDRAQPDFRLLSEGGRLILTGRRGEPLSTVAADRPDAARQMVDRIAHWGRWHAILSISNPSPTVDVDLRITRLGAPEDSPAPKTISAGNEIDIRVTNRSAGDLFIIVLDLASDGSICVLYPSAGNCRILDQRDPLASGGVLSLPPVRSSVPEGKDRVTDIVKVFATTQKISPRIFQLSPVARSVEARAALPADPLARYLASATRGLTRNFETVAAEGWVTREQLVQVERPGTRTSGIALHFANPERAVGARDRLAGSRSLCGTGATGPCYELVPLAGDPTIVEVRTPEVRAGRSEVLSVGRVFEEAYRLGEEADAERAEPLFEYDVSAMPSTTPGEARGGGDDQHDPRAEADTLWSHKFVRVAEARQTIRDRHGREPGAEAEGVVIGHPDTGYTRHPEIWPADPDRRPLLPDMGYDYYRGDHDPTDELLDQRFLDNPAHGTGSSSAIISPEGCQLAGEEKCPTGIALGASLVPLRVNRSVVQFNTRNLAQVILDAAGDDRSRVKLKPDYLAIAMGGVPSWTLWKAVRRAEKQGLLVIAAAGNYVRTVVWPARFRSVIAVAAINAGCEPWQHSSRGPAVDFSAPGESVWRATIDDAEPPNEIAGMGKGTTYATATTGGVAALWFAYHGEALAELRASGQLTAAFRELAASTAWRPDGDSLPTGVSCNPDAGWDGRRLGSGILDAAALLEAPLQSRAAVPRLATESIDELPLWSSLYDEATPRARRLGDYRRLFGLDPGAELSAVARFEAEVLYQYGMDAAVQDAVDTIVFSDSPPPAAFEALRDALRGADLSRQLRSAL